MSEGRSVRFEGNDYYRTFITRCGRWECSHGPWRPSSEFAGGYVTRTTLAMHTQALHYEVSVLRPQTHGSSERLREMSDTTKRLTRDPRNYGRMVTHVSDYFARDVKK